MEYRFDRATNDESGFYAGFDHHLVSNQNLLVVALIWSLDRTPTEN